MSSRSRKRRSEVVDSDLEELITEVKKKLESKKKEDAKCALLFGCSLFPNNLELKKLAYNCAKDHNEPYEAAKFFHGLYPQCNKWNEVEKILKDVQSQQKTILSEIFYYLPCQMQYEMVNAYAQSLESPSTNRKSLEHIHHSKEIALLKLHTLKEQFARQNGKFFSTAQQSQVMQQIDRVIHSFLSAETDFLAWLASSSTAPAVATGSTPLNWYRFVILQEIFPLVSECISQGCHIGDKTLIQRMFTNVLQFLLCYATHIPRLCPNVNATITPSPAIVEVPPKVKTSSQSPEPVSDVAVVLVKPWATIRSVLQQASHMFNWSLKDKDVNKMSTDSALELLKQWNSQLQSSHSSRHQTANSSGTNSPKLARLEVGAVYWSFLSEAIMRYLRASRPSLFRVESSTKTEQLQSNVAQSSTVRNIVTMLQSPEDEKDIFFLQKCAAGSKGDTSHVMECGALFDIAIRLYESLSGTAANKYTSKLEANLRVSAHWVFDRIFFVDYYTSRATLQGASSALLVLDTLAPVFECDTGESTEGKKNESVLHNAFLKAVLKLQLGLREEAWTLLWLCYESLIQPLSNSTETSSAFHSRLEQSLLPMSEQGQSSVRDASSRGSCSHDDLLQTFCRFLFDDVHILHFVIEFLLCHVIMPLMKHRRNDIQLALASLILVQVLLPLRIHPDCPTRSLSANQTFIQNALDSLHEALVFAKHQSTSSNRENMMQWMEFVEDYEMRGHLFVLLQNCLVNESEDQKEYDPPDMKTEPLDSTASQLSHSKTNKWSHVLRFITSRESLFKTWIVDLSSFK